MDKIPNTKVCVTVIYDVREKWGNQQRILTVAVRRKEKNQT